MLIFDPAALPDDYDTRMRDDPLAVIEPLANEGRIYWLDTHADGGYCLGISVDGDLPPEHVAFARKIGSSEHFAAPSGMLYFTGIEYAFRYDDSFFRKHPHMGSCLAIASGIYQLTLYEMDYPDKLHDNLLRQRLSVGRFLLYSLMSRLAPVGCISTLVLIVSAFPLGLRVWSRTALPICLALILPAFLLSLLRPYREAQQAKRAIEREYPNLFAVLKLTTPTAFRQIH